MHQRTFQDETRSESPASNVHKSTHREFRLAVENAEIGQGPLRISTLRDWRFNMMMRVLALIVFSVILGTALAVRSHGQKFSWTLDSVLKQLDDESKSFQSLTANIDRTKVTVVVNDKSTESGQMWVRRDDKMRIDFEKPDKREILRNGNALDVYTPKISRVEEYDLGKHRALVDQFLLLGFGTSGSSLEKSYLVTFLGEEAIDGRRTVKLELTPKSEDVRGQVSKIHIWVDIATWLPAQQQFFETGSGDYLLIHYTNVVKNVHINDQQFKPNWPKTVSHIKPTS
jgi:outer membrane lipoprotein-sorting protein